ncbi:MAG: hypothetical protein M1816_003235 [Peltula sp. TS41687]|nr:MAG: hypothetical protein M1816_003235 [Peltula sp. TS41687]
MISDHTGFGLSSEVENLMRFRGIGSRRKEDEAENDCDLDDIGIFLDLRSESSSLWDTDSWSNMDDGVYDESIDLSFQDGQLYHPSTFAAMSQDWLVKCEDRQYNWHRSYLKHSRDPARTDLYSLSIGSTKSIETQHSTFNDVNSSTISIVGSVTPTPITGASSSAVQVPSSPPSSDPSGPKLEVDTEVDGALDNSNFLSFEEWKKQNLARAGQSAESLENRRTSSSGSERRHRPGNINNALDSLGEDTEIDLDFGGFRSTSNGVDSRRNSVQVAEAQRGIVEGASTPQGGGDGDGTQRPRARNKDAGKTCKERFNYASFDCAANVLKTNSEAKGSSSILVENKDSYMLNECAANNKFFIVELCDDILVDTIVLANFEFFSSIFRTFRVSVSDRYPVKIDRWKELGTFEAQNRRDLQVFLVENPLIWARYLRVEILTHFGKEFYCPISLLRVHGTTMMEEFKHQVETAKGEDETEDDLAEEVEPTVQTPPDGDTVKVEGLSSLTNGSANDTIQGPALNGSLSYKYGDGTKAIDPSNMDSNISSVAITPTQTSREENAKALVPRTALSDSSDLPQHHRHDTNTTTTTSSVPVPSSSQSLPQPSSASTVSVKASPTSSHLTTQPSMIEGRNISSVSTDPASKFSALQNTTSFSSETPSSKTNHGHQSDTEKTVPSAIQPPPPNPTTQESFFKTIHKRLQLLEANATLSLQYIEEQSRILRDAFNKVEKRQLGKTTAFLENLNSTVLAELKGFRQQYDQIWQSTVIELETQREQSQKEMLEVSARLSILADEVVFQKRMSIIQSGLILLCLGLIIFSRGGGGAANHSYLELPMMLSKSSSSLRASLESPSPSLSPSPASTRPNSAAQNGRPFGGGGGGRGGGMSSAEESNNGGSQSSHPLATHLTLEFSPPTPTSTSSTTEDFSSSDRDERTERSASPSPSPDPSPPRIVTARPPIGVVAKAESTPTTPTMRRRAEQLLRDAPAAAAAAAVETWGEEGKEPGEGDATTTSMADHLGTGRRT